MIRFSQLEEARASGHHWHVESLDGARHSAASTTESPPTTANGDSYRTSPSKLRKKDRSKDKDIQQRAEK